MIEDLRHIISSFQIQGELTQFKPHAVGLINDTFYIETSTASNLYKYILQQVNVFVFPHPERIMENIATVYEALSASDYPLTVLKATPTKKGSDLYQSSAKSYWRLFPFIENTYTINSVNEESVAYEAANSFGEYTRYMEAVDLQKLHTTIPDFHNTPLRYSQFKTALKQVDEQRQTEAYKEIEILLSYQYLLASYEGFSYLKRPVHYDTKINNILFDKETHRPKAIVDLDTLMPGFLPYDFGDMVRTYTPSVDENEKDWKQVGVRENILQAITAGYLDGIRDSIHPVEKKHLTDGAVLIIYEQALRFLTDFLLGDQYYKVEYPNQNLYRTRNQIALLKDYLGILSRK